MMDSTSSLSSFSAVTANVISSFSYDYKINNTTVVATSTLPTSPQEGVGLYLIG